LIHTEGRVEEKGGDQVKREILGAAILFLCFSLLASNASSVEIPVEVERIKDVCFLRIRGAHQLPPDPNVEVQPGYGAFLLHYENLIKPPPNEICHQDVSVTLLIPSSNPQEPPYLVHIEFDATNDVPVDRILWVAPIGSVMDFVVQVYFGSQLQATIDGAVVIPPA
jgi:hypothetical protein